MCRGGVCTCPDWAGLPRMTYRDGRISFASTHRAPDVGHVIVNEEACASNFARGCGHVLEHFLDALHVFCSDGKTVALVHATRVIEGLHIWEGANLFKCVDELR